MQMDGRSDGQSGGQTDGRTVERTGGRTDGRSDGRAGGRTDGGADGPMGLRRIHTAGVDELRVFHEKVKLPKERLKICHFKK